MNLLVAKIMSKVVLAERNIKVKLLGDSITHGVGGTGFAQNGEALRRVQDGQCEKNKVYFPRNMPI